MEKNKLATLVVTSMLAVLATESTKNEYNDRNICESSVISQVDVRTCNQCNMPRPRGEG
jgi:hypothetical protein